MPPKRKAPAKAKAKSKAPAKGSKAPAASKRLQPAPKDSTARARATLARLLKANGSEPRPEAYAETGSYLVCDLCGRKPITGWFYRCKDHKADICHPCAHHSPKVVKLAPLTCYGWAPRLPAELAGIAKFRLVQRAETDGCVDPDGWQFMDVKVRPERADAPATEIPPSMMVDGEKSIASLAAAMSKPAAAKTPAVKPSAKAAAKLSAAAKATAPASAGKKKMHAAKPGPKIGRGGAKGVSFNFAGSSDDELDGAVPAPLPARGDRRPVAVAAGAEGRAVFAELMSLTTSSQPTSTAPNPTRRAAAAADATAPTPRIASAAPSPPQEPVREPSVASSLPSVSSPTDGDPEATQLGDAAAAAAAETVTEPGDVARANSKRGRSQEAPHESATSAPPQPTAEAPPKAGSSGSVVPRADASEDRSAAADSPRPDKASNGPSGPIATADPDSAIMRFFRNFVCAPQPAPDVDFEDTTESWTVGPGAVRVEPGDGASVSAGSCTHQVAITHGKVLDVRVVPMCESEGLWLSALIRGAHVSYIGIWEVPVTSSAAEQQRGITKGRKAAGAKVGSIGDAPELGTPVLRGTLHAGKDVVHAFEWVPLPLHTSMCLGYATLIKDNVAMSGNVPRQFGSKTCAIRLSGILRLHSQDLQPVASRWAVGLHREVSDSMLYVAHRCATVIAYRIVHHEGGRQLVLSACNRFPPPRVSVADPFGTNELVMAVGTRPNGNSFIAVAKGASMSVIERGDVLHCNYHPPGAITGLVATPKGVYCALASGATAFVRLMGKDADVPGLKHSIAAYGVCARHEDVVTAHGNGVINVWAPPADLTARLQVQADDAKHHVTVVSDEEAARSPAVASSSQWRFEFHPLEVSPMHRYVVGRCVGSNVVAVLDTKFTGGQ